MYEDIKTAVLYVRFSSSNQTEQSIEGQTRVCRKFCANHNIRVTHVYADRATSAHTHIEKRVEFLKMIEDSKKGTFDAVIVYALDRFSRSRYDMATYKHKLRKNGVKLISATEQISEDPNGIILESVLEGMAEFYSAELSQKINRGLMESAYKHKSIGGHAPLGYKVVDKRLVPDPETAHIVQEAFQMYADGVTVAEICRVFNAKGYKTSKGARFGKSSFSKLFHNERYIGTYEFRDYKQENAIPAIIDRDLWDRVQTRSGPRKAPGSYKAKVPYLLSGKVRCGKCGYSMNGERGSRQRRYYYCYGRKNHPELCDERSIRAEYLDDIVTDAVLEQLTDDRIEELATLASEENDRVIAETTHIPELEERLEDITSRLNNIMEAIEKAGEAPEMLVKRLSDLEKEKRALSSQLKAEESSIVRVEKERVIFWLEQFRSGDVQDPVFRQLMIDALVKQVLVEYLDEEKVFQITVEFIIGDGPCRIQAPYDLVCVQIQQAYTFSTIIKVDRPKRKPPARHRGKRKEASIRS